MMIESHPHDDHDLAHVSAARFAAVRAIAMPFAIVVAAYMITATFGAFFIYLAAFAPLGVVAGFGRGTARRVVWRTAAIAQVVAVVIALAVWGALHQYGPWSVVIALFGGFPLGIAVAAVWGAVTAHRHARRGPEATA